MKNVDNSTVFVQDTHDIKQLQTKCFNDPIHGHIQLHPLLVKVIDTPQFQRLRNIKQLGGTYFVFPGASHHRFEHCIGTCHLAGKLARHLKELHPKLIDDKDVICVELAALCKDLGRGPFSHMFDMKFIPKVNPHKTWKHEDTCSLMLDHMIRENNLENAFREHGIDLDRDIIFIKEMIKPPPDKKNQQWKYKGRGREKSFLYEIVCNKRNKVDVNKWDYFARDCHHLGIKNSFNHNRFMQFTKVLAIEGEDRQICARDKVAFSLYDMFTIRASLHRVAYQHKTKIAIEAMICDAMLLANNHIKYAGKDGKLLSISDTIKDMVAYEKLTDYVFHEILHSTDTSEEMEQARNLLQRVLRRDLYKYVGEFKPPKNDVTTPTLVVCERLQEDLASYDRSVQPDDIVVSVKAFDFGMSEKNPCDQFRFYSKHNPNTPYQIRREEISHMLPDTFKDCQVQIYCKTSDKANAVINCLNEWGKTNTRVKVNTVRSSLTPVTQIRKRRNTENEAETSSKRLKF